MCVATVCLYVHDYLSGIWVITILPHVLPPKYHFPSILNSYVTFFLLRNVFHARNHDVATLWLDVSRSVPYEIACITMQARAVVDIDMYVCVAIFCLYVNYTHQLLESLAYNLMLSLPSWDGSITCARNTSGKRQTGNILRAFFFLVYCPVFCSKSV